MGKQRHKRGTVGASAPLPSIALPPPAPFWRVAAMPTLAAAALVASVWFYLRSSERPPAPADNPRAEAARRAWEPVTEDDRLVDAFRKARNADPESTSNLAPAPVFDDEPVSEAECEAKQAGYFLHRARQIVTIRPGEPGKGGGWLDTPSRYTLATRIGATTPKVAVKVGDRVGMPFELSMLHPDIVVEVRGGRIHALRAEMRRD